MHHICMVRANRFPSFSSFPPDSIPPPEFWIIFFVFIPYHPKGFQFYRYLQLSGVLDLSSENSTRLLVASGVGLLVDRCKRIWKCARRAAKGGCGSSMARGFSETRSPTEFKECDVDMFPEALVLRSLRPVPGVWRLPVWEQAEDINSECFSCLRLRGHFEREFHKESITNCLEPCLVFWSLFIKSGRRLRSGQSWKCR